ncbi:MAG: response regulator [Acidobacteria bacterium]|nr:response regulator [Acidobacteriota bacterium]
MKVLLIDDEDDIRKIAGLGLSRIGGMEVLDASSGAAGLALAKSGKPDVILLDMMMPVMDGEMTLQALNSDPETRHIPVIFLTAKALSAEIERFRTMGVAGILTKPFDPVTLADDVRRVLAEVRSPERVEPHEARP